MNGESVKVVKAKSAKLLQCPRTCARGGSFPQCDEWMMAPSMLPYHEFGKMEENRQTRSEQEIAKRDRAREGRCVLLCDFAQFESQTCQIKGFQSKYVTFLSIFLTFASYPPIYLQGAEEKKEEQMNKGGVRQGTTTNKRCERRKKEGKKASERRAKEERMQEKRVKGE